ncbi:hypothetical protein [Geobacillus kaustophilus]|uniref:hypothetical protein n=1 Tax=Geobacillus kaustophilus TaxID=1462 RepID=UPI0005CD6D61|nr:hypothetical protein [Geobacillus kaustophilus]
MEQLTIFDFEKLYGKEHVSIAKAFRLDEQPIKTPLSYKKMIEVLLYHHASRYGQNAYLEALRTYNQDVSERFKNTINVLNSIIMQTTGLFGAIANGRPIGFHGFFISDEYTKLFKDTDSGRSFKSEQYLEKVLFEAINDLAWSYSSEGQAFEAKRQSKLKNGEVDILFLNDRNAIVFELKKGTAKRRDLFQVVDYSNSPELSDKKVERVLVAKKFGDDVLSLAEELSVSCISYTIGYNHSDPYFLLLVSMENRIEDNEILNRYLDDRFKWSDVFEGYAVLYDFIHPNFDGSIKEFYLKKMDELKREVDLIEKLTQLYAEKYLLK